MRDFLQVKRPAASALLWLLVLTAYPALLTSLFAGASHLPAGMFLRLGLAVCYNTLFFLALICLIHSLPGPLLRHVCNRALAVFLGLFVFASIYHYCLFGRLMALDTYTALLDSNFGETTEFLGTFARMDYFGISLLAASPLLYLAVRPLHLSVRPYKKWLVSSIAFGVILAILWFGAQQKIYISDNNAVVATSSYIYEALDEKVMMAAASKKLLGLQAHVTISGSNAPVTHVLVIGESTTRRHMSLYGYNRNTSPELSQMHDLYVARNVCSSRSQTVQSLRELLTFATRENLSPLLTEPGLIQIMNSAGFHTYWISNQVPAGEFSSWASLLAKPSRTRIFVNEPSWFDTEGESLDEKLLTPFKQALSDHATHRFIILHLLGTHFAYKYRYPASFNVFTRKHDIPLSLRQKWHDADSSNKYNQYDNAVRYNDYILSRIISELKTQPRATLTYVSDHGEVVGDGWGAADEDYFGHIAESPYRRAYEVPLLFWMSPAVQNDFHGKLEAFNKNLTKPYQIDNLIHTLLDIYQVHNQSYQQRNSLLSAAFQPSPRHCDSVIYQ